jgi:hypothetical protein
VIAVTLQYFHDCPTWQIARDRLLDAIDRLGRDLFKVDLRLITGYQQAVAEGFRGSPAFLVDGRDPFADHHVPVGLTCRSYPTEAGPAGAPTLEQLLQVLERARAARSAPTGCRPDGGLAVGAIHLSVSQHTTRQQIVTAAVALGGAATRASSGPVDQWRSGSRSTCP